MDNSQPREECDEVGQGDSHIDKFQLQREILTVCSTVFIDKIQPVELCVHLSDIIGKAEEDKIKAATDEKGPRKGAELLLSFVLESTDPGWFTVFVNGLKETGSETALEILEDFKALSDFSQHVDGMKYDLNSVRFEDLHEKHLRVFRPHIIEYLEPIQLLPHLIQRGVLSDSTVDRIRAETRNKGRYYGSLLLLRHLPTLKKTWYTDFLYSLWNSGNQKDKELVQLIDPDFNPDWKQYQTSQKRTVTKEIAGDTIDAVPPKWRKYGSADEGRNITGAEVEQVSLKLSDLNITDELSLRNYQHELAEPALRGQNCIIVAPTGSGKTRVAAHIVAEHLKQGADRKVVFMACKVPLVEQQYQLFCQLFEKYELRVLKVCGDDESNKFLHQLISEFDIIVLTPQILENHLLENTISSLDVFSLLIFDECHHTQKGNPYNAIMSRYIRQKHRDKMVKLPQIVGMTASLGVGDAKTDYEAESHILHLCANLDSRCIATVERYRDELDQYVNTPNEEFQPLPNRQEDPFRVKIIAIMKRIESIIKQSPICYDLLSSGNKALTKAPNERDSQQYHQWATQLGKIAPTVSQNPELTRTIVTCTDYLQGYNVALGVNRNARTSDAVEYLVQKFSPYSTRQHIQTALEKELFQMFEDVRPEVIKLAEDPRYQNPRLLQLQQRIEGNTRALHSRGIIFVTTLAIVQALYDWLTELDLAETVRPEKFTGARASEEQGGMTQHEQENILAKFRTGECRLLIATTVAEEGLDIPECNFVILYNHIGNEISTVQTRGRNRAKDATSYVMAEDRFQLKAALNCQKEKMMNKAVAVMKRKLEREDVSQQIMTFQREEIKKMDIEAIKRQKKLAKKSSEEFHLVCRKCQTFAASTANLRKIKESHHVVLDEDFQNKIQLKDPKKVIHIDGMELQKKIVCAKCPSLEWGTLALYEGEMYYVIAIKAFNVKTVDGQYYKPCQFKHWIDAPFKVEPLDAMVECGKPQNI